MNQFIIYGRKLLISCRPFCTGYKYLNKFPQAFTDTEGYFTQ